MLNVSDVTKNAYKTDSKKKNIVITIEGGRVLENEDIVSESITLTEILESNKYLNFCGCNATKLEFQCSDIPEDVRGKKISVKITMEGCDDIPLFNGRIDEQNNRNHEDVITKIVAYDDLYRVTNIDVTEWYDGLTFPMLLKNFRSQLCSYVGMNSKPTVLPNDNLSLDKSIESGSVNAGNLLKWICQANARYGRIGRDGKFEFVKLNTLTDGVYPSETLYPSDSLFPSGENASETSEKALYSSCSYEPYQVDMISKVSIFDKEGINIDYGIGSNVFNIHDNPIAYGINRVTASHNIYNEVCNLPYTPAKVGIIGLPYLECGDSLRFNTNKNIVRTYILKRTLKGIQMLTDSFESDSDKSQPSYKETLATTVSRNGKSILKISADIVEMNELISKKATIEQLNSTNARVGTIEANYITASTVASNYATIGNLESVSARVGTIETDYVTAGTLNAKNFTANHVTAGTINGNYVQWQKINCIGSGSFGYLYKNNSTKDIVFTSTDQAPNPSYTRLCGFLDGLHVKSFYTLAKDNA